MSVGILVKMTGIPKKIRLEYPPNKQKKNYNNFVGLSDKLIVMPTKRTQKKILPKIMWVFWSR